MNFNLKIVKVDTKYCDYLRGFDNKVSYNKDSKELRPFVGVLFKIKNILYFAPLSSPKPKHLNMKNTLDFYKIDDGKLGAVNFNNMIPVRDNNFIEIDLNKKCHNISDIKYQKLLIEQLTWLNEHSIQLKKKSYNLYKLYINKKLPKSLINRCCNFKLLEEKCALYNEEKVLN